MAYCTIICDIKSSRKIENREEIQYKIIDMLKETNKIFKDLIISPFLITIGDEWQGLTKYPCDYLKIINFFKEYIPSKNFIQELE